MCPQFADGDDLLVDIAIRPESAGLVRHLATVSPPGAVEPYPHCMYALAPDAPRVAISHFSVATSDLVWQSQDNLVATYRPGDAASIAILEPSPDADAYQSWVTSLALTPDGRRLAAGTRGGAVTVWNTDDVAHPRRLLTAGSVLQVAFAPAGDVLATMIASYAPTRQAAPASLSVWDASSGERIRVLPSESSLRRSGAFIDWGATKGCIGFDHPATVVAAGWDYHVRVWDYARDDLVATIRCASPPRAVVLDKNWVFVAEGATVKRRDRSAVQGEIDAFAATELNGGGDDPISQLVLSPSGDVLAIAREQGRVDLWEPTEPRLLHSVHLGTTAGTGVYKPKCAAFSIDARRLFIQHRVLAVGLDGPVADWPCPS